MSKNKNSAQFYMILIKKTKIYIRFAFIVKPKGCLAVLASSLCVNSSITPFAPLVPAQVGKVPAPLLPPYLRCCVRFFREADCTSTFGVPQSGPLLAPKVLRQRCLPLLALAPSVLVPGRSKRSARSGRRRCPARSATPLATARIAPCPCALRKGKGSFVAAKPCAPSCAPSVQAERTQATTPLLAPKAHGVRNTFGPLAQHSGRVRGNEFPRRTGLGTTKGTPPKYLGKFFNQCFDKGRLKNFVLWFLLNYGEYRTVRLVEQLKNIGFYYASKAGISLGIDDLKIPPKKANLMYEAENQTIQTTQQYNRGEITGVERFQRLIDTWHRTSEILKQEVIDYFEATDILNPVYMMAFSGARGNISQVRQLVGMRGLMADPQGQIIDFPIRSNFREGLTVTEYIISSYGARKGIVDTALRTANAGYLTRRLVDVAQHVIISNFDCTTTRGIFLINMKEGTKTIHSLNQRLVGRILARDLFIPNFLHNSTIGGLERENADQTKLASRNEEITLHLAFEISKNFNKVFVRSPLTCQKPICQLCYGWSLAQGSMVSIGEAVGIVAAQSIGEPGTQLTMRTFHTGGVFSGDISDQIKAPFNGIIEYLSPIPGTLIRTPEGKIAFLTKSEGSFLVKKIINSQKGISQNVEFEAKKFTVPHHTLLYIRNSQNVYEKEVIAQISSISQKTNVTDEAELTIKSDIEGQFYSKFLTFREKLIGLPLTSRFSLKQSVVTNNQEKIYEAWTWSYAWVLSGKIYEFKNSLTNLPLAPVISTSSENSINGEKATSVLNEIQHENNTPFLPITGDWLTNKSYMTQTRWGLQNKRNLDFYYTKRTPSTCSLQDFSKENIYNSFNNLKNSNIIKATPIENQPILAINLNSIYFKNSAYVFEVSQQVQLLASFTSPKTTLAPSFNLSTFARAPKGQKGARAFKALQNDFLFFAEVSFYKKQIGLTVNNKHFAKAATLFSQKPSLSNINKSRSRFLSLWANEKLAKSSKSTNQNANSLAQGQVVEVNAAYTAKDLHEQANAENLSYIVQWFPNKYKTDCGGVVFFNRSKFIKTFFKNNEILLNNTVSSNTKQLFSKQILSYQTIITNTSNNNNSPLTYDYNTSSPSCVRKVLADPLSLLSSSAPFLQPLHKMPGSYSTTEVTKSIDSHSLYNIYKDKTMSQSIFETDSQTANLKNQLIINRYLFLKTRAIQNLKVFLVSYNVFKIAIDNTSTSYTTNEIHNASVRVPSFISIYLNTKTSLFQKNRQGIISLFQFTPLKTNPIYKVKDSTYNKTPYYYAKLDTKQSVGRKLISSDQTTSNLIKIKTFFLNSSKNETGSFSEAAKTGARGERIRTRENALCYSALSKRAPAFLYSSSVKSASESMDFWCQPFKQERRRFFYPIGQEQKMGPLKKNSSFSSLLENIFFSSNQDVQQLNQILNFINKKSNINLDQMPITKIGYFINSIRIVKLLAFENTQCGNLLLFCKKLDFLQTKSSNEVIHQVFLKNLNSPLAKTDRAVLFFNLIYKINLLCFENKTTLLNKSFNFLSNLNNLQIFKLVQANFPSQQYMLYSYVSPRSGVADAHYYNPNCATAGSFLISNRQRDRKKKSNTIYKMKNVNITPFANSIEVLKARASSLNSNANVRKSTSLLITKKEHRKGLQRGFVNQKIQIFFKNFIKEQAFKTNYLNQFYKKIKTISNKSKFYLFTNMQPCIDLTQTVLSATTPTAETASTAFSVRNPTKTKNKVFKNKKFTKKTLLYGTTKNGWVVVIPNKSVLQKEKKFTNYHKKIIYPGKSLFNNVVFNQLIFIESFLITNVFNIKNVFSFYKHLFLKQTSPDAKVQNVGTLNQTEKEGINNNGLVSTQENNNGFNKNNYNKKSFPSLTWINNRKCRFLLPEVKEKAFEAVPWRGYPLSLNLPAPTSFPVKFNSTLAFLLQPVKEFDETNDFSLKKYAMDFVGPSITGKTLQQLSTDGFVPVELLGRGEALLPLLRSFRYSTTESVPSAKRISGPLALAPKVFREAERRARALCARATRARARARGLLGPLGPQHSYAEKKRPRFEKAKFTSFDAKTMLFNSCHTLTATKGCTSLALNYQVDKDPGPGHYTVNLLNFKVKKQTRHKVKNLKRQPIFINKSFDSVFTLQQLKNKNAFLIKDTKKMYTGSAHNNPLLALALAPSSSASCASAPHKTRTQVQVLRKAHSIAEGPERTSSLGARGFRRNRMKGRTGFSEPVRCKQRSKFIFVSKNLFFLYLQNIELRTLLQLHSTLYFTTLDLKVASNFLNNNIELLNSLLVFIFYSIYVPSLKPVFLVNKNHQRVFLFLSNNIKQLPSGGFVSLAERSSETNPPIDGLFNSTTKSNNNGAVFSALNSQNIKLTAQLHLADSIQDIKKFNFISNPNMFNFIKPIASRGLSALTASSLISASSSASCSLCFAPLIRFAGGTPAVLRKAHSCAEVQGDKLKGQSYFINFVSRKQFNLSPFLIRYSNLSNLINNQFENFNANNVDFYQPLTSQGPTNQIIPEIQKSLAFSLGGLRPTRPNFEGVALCADNGVNKIAKTNFISAGSKVSLAGSENGFDKTNSQVVDSLDATDNDKTSKTSEVNESFLKDKSKFNFNFSCSPVSNFDNILYFQPAFSSTALLGRAGAVAAPNPCSINNVVSVLDFYINYLNYKRSNSRYLNKKTNISKSARALPSLSSTIFNYALLFDNLFESPCFSFNVINLLELGFYKVTKTQKTQFLYAPFKNNNTNYFNSSLLRHQRVNQNSIKNDKSFINYDFIKGKTNYYSPFKGELAFATAAVNHVNHSCMFLTNNDLVSYYLPTQLIHNNSNSSIVNIKRPVNFSLTQLRPSTINGPFLTPFTSSATPLLAPSVLGRNYGASACAKPPSCAKGARVGGSAKAMGTFFREADATPSASRGVVAEQNYYQINNTLIKISLSTIKQKINNIKLPFPEIDQFESHKQASTGVVGRCPAPEGTTFPRRYPLASARKRSLRFRVADAHQKFIQISNMPAGKPFVTGSPFRMTRMPSISDPARYACTCWMSGFAATEGAKEGASAQAEGAYRFAEGKSTASCASATRNTRPCLRFAEEAARGGRCKRTELRVELMRILKNVPLLGDFCASGDPVTGTVCYSGLFRQTLITLKNEITPFRYVDHLLPGTESARSGRKPKKLVVQTSGQIIHYNNSKVTIRRAQPVFISPKGVLHKFDGDFIDPKSPIITLSYQQLKTGDIIQGIPKVEQFFEARTTKRGRLFRDSLPSLLKALFKRYQNKLPLESAVRQSFYKIQQIIVDGVQRVYKSQGVTISDKHLEVIVQQMTSKVRIIDGAQTGFFPGEVVDLTFIEKVNQFLINKVLYEPLVLGITKASLEVDSFLSASSFQQTTRVLSQAAIYRKKDFLKGLKENVILGNLIPAGTGYLVQLDDL